MTRCDAVVKNGQLLTDTPLPFPDGTRVKIHVEAAEDDPLLFLANHAVATGISDLAERHDYYIYGTAQGPQ